ncbi:MAG TPA: beta-propeller fold lactonase family protein, partial [Myxococcota bacterium]|nr:beta-propeller fold lactonase family protein [Myxococcota bacterium]
MGALLALAASPAAAEPPLALLQNGQGLAGISRQSNDVAVSPDGRHVYAATNDWAITFRREADGRLAFVAETTLLPWFGRRVAVTPDGAHVLVLVDTAGAAAVVVYARDTTTGALTFVEIEAEQLGGSASSLAVTGDGERVYVASPDQGAIVAYARNPASGLLAFAQRVGEGDPGVAGLLTPGHLAVSPDDRHLYATSFVEQGEEFAPAIARLRREDDGSLSFVGADETGLQDPSAEAGPADLLVAPDGGELLVLDGGIPNGPGAAARRFARDPEHGTLAYVGSEPLTEPGVFEGELDWFALRPDGRRLFAGGYNFGDAICGAPVCVPVVTWTRDGAGALAPLGRVESSGGIGAHGVVSPDGRYVYATPAQGVRVLVPEARGASAALAAL